MFKNFPDILTISQVAQALCIGKKSAYNLVHDHKLGALHMGKKILVPKFALEEYVKTARLNVVL